MLVLFSQVFAVIIGNIRGLKVEFDAFLTKQLEVLLVLFVSRLNLLSTFMITTVLF